MKKQITLIGIVLFSIFFSSFKGIEPDSRILAYLGQQKTEQLQKANPDLIRYYNFFLDNSYTIAEVPQQKLDENNLPELILPIKNGHVDTKKLNVLTLNIKRHYDQAVYYKVKNTKEIFIMLSEKDFIKKYNEYRKKLGLIKE